MPWHRRLKSAAQALGWERTNLQRSSRLPEQGRKVLPCGVARFADASALAFQSSLERRSGLAGDL